jgi:hypothetical protein
MTRRSINQAKGSPARRTGALGALPSVLAGIAGILLLLGTTHAATPVVVDFDSLSVLLDLTNTGYAGLTWEPGNAGYGGKIGYWVLSSSTTAGYPHSIPNNVSNGWGCTEIGIGFPTVVDLQGAYIAGQGDEQWTTGVRVHGYLAGQFVGSTPWFTSISSTPIWFDINLTGVDRILVESVPTYFGGGWFGMDDLTFTYIPEPAGLAALAALSACFLRRRRRLRGSG